MVQMSGMTHPVTSIEVSNPEDLVAAIRSGNFEPCLLTRNAGSSWLARISCPDVCLDLAKLSSSFLFTGVMPEDYYTLMFVVECPTQGKAFNLQVDHQDGYMAMYPPGHEVDAYTPEGYSSATLTVPIHLFHEIVEKSFPEIPQKLLQRGTGIRIGEQEQVRLRILLAGLREEAGDSEAAAAGPNGRLVLQQQLLDAFLMALSSGLQSPGPRLKQRAVGAMKRMREARDLISKSHDHPMLSIELSERLGMSRRGVELLFRKSLGVGPGKYIQLHRLHGVRRELLSSESGSARINDVATKWGFTHLGHFSRNYRLLFGENPRDTLTGR